MRNTIFILMALMGLLFTGCQSTSLEQTAFEAPWPMPDSWNGQSAALEPWLQQFEDSDLEALIDQGLAANYNLQQAALRMQRASQQAMVAGSSRWPSIGGGFDASRTERNRGIVEGVTTTVTEDYGISLNLSWELDLWGKLADRQFAAESEWEAVKEDYAAARLSLAARIAQAWYNAVTATEQVRIAEEALRSSENSLASIDDLLLSGLSSALDVRLSRANAETARNNLLLRRLTLERVIRNLEVLVGDYPAAKLTVHDRGLPALTSTPSTGVPAELVNRRPDLRAATQRLYAAGYKVNEAEKELLPAIRLTGRGGTSADSISDVFDSDFRFSNIAAGLTQPFFQGKRLKAGAAIAKTDRELALVGLYDAALGAFQEVEIALVTERSLKQQAAALGKVNLEYEEAERLALGQYEDGLADILTVLDAQRRYFQSQQQLMQVRNQLIQNRIDLVLALGGDFENGDPIATPAPGDVPESVDVPERLAVPEPAEIQPLPVPEPVAPVHYKKPVLPLIPKNILRLPVEQP